MTEAAEPTPKTSAITVRAATIADAAAIAGIHVRSWIATYRRPPGNRGIDYDIAHRADIWELRLHQPGIGRQIFVAEENSAVRGFIYFGPSPDADHDPVITGQIFSIHVEPALTNRGIGRRLIDDATDELRNAGRSSASLWVVKANRQSRGFYERLGWRPDGKGRQEELALEGEEGDRVEVIRYQMDLAPLDPEGQ